MYVVICTGRSQSRALRFPPGRVDRRQSEVRGSAMSATATAAAGPRQGRSQRVRERLRGRWAWPAGYVAAAALFFLCCLRLSGTQPVTSDPATIALQAWDMLHGNWLLTGWSLADVSFYTTELPEYI